MQLLPVGLYAHRAHHASAAGCTSVQRELLAARAVAEQHLISTELAEENTLVKVFGC